MRLATIATARGPRLHVKARSGYVDVGEATNDERMSALQYVLEAGEPAMDTIRGLQTRDGREIADADFAAAVPAPSRILCLGLNYSEHALEGGRAVPTWPDAFVRGTDSVLGPYADLVKPALTDRFDYEAELGIVIGHRGPLHPGREGPRRHRGLRRGQRRLGPGLAARGQPVDGRKELHRQYADRSRGGHHR